MLCKVLHVVITLPSARLNPLYYTTVLFMYVLHLLIFTPCKVYLRIIYTPQYTPCTTIVNDGFYLTLILLVDIF